VAGIFVIDPSWFGNPEKTGAFQAAFWLAALRELQQNLAERNIPLAIRTHVDPIPEILRAATEIGADTITYNKEYEPDQIAMDMGIEREAAKMGIKVQAFKDAVMWEEQEILTGQSGIYSVFTPYKNAYLKKQRGQPPTVRGLPRKPPNAVSISSDIIPTAEALGYRQVALDIPTAESGGTKMLADFCGGPLQKYADTRDFPAAAGTSRLSAHLNAGTVSIRQAFATAMNLEQGISRDTWIGELIWREFYRMILFNFPHTVSGSFQERYAALHWENNPAHMDAWTQSRTGYPIVDAAMAQLHATGFMHNRLRMIAAMFLTKDLDTHWVLGERYFMKTLMDYDQGCNVGGWQWSASTGNDAAPYFRIMNPTLQGVRYDPDGSFVKRFIPALSSVPANYIHAPWEMPADLQKQARCIIGQDYPAPIVDHQIAKLTAISKFKKMT
jgi:deoxyribodipyrimidine photo-lyase